MRYMRCKCGARECWTSMGHATCDPCEDCGTTLAESPNGHVPVTEHRWSEPRGEIDAKTGERWQQRTCVACMKTERITESVPTDAEGAES